MLNNSLTEPALIGLAYLLGSIPTALWVCHSMGIPDPRQQGSKNPGASNVLRIGNRRAALFTLLGDISKGALAVSLVLWTQPSATLVTLSVLAAFLGHLYPLFGAYRGGKGVAIFLGCTLCLSPALLLVQLLIWASVFALTRIASLASVALALSTPLAAWYLAPEWLSLVSLIGLLLIARHRDNLVSLWRGQEHRF
ncbi:glycerol-3-phosphate 1-O-acyltransferase PlsY [Nitrincola tapanii]|uniref:Glycerol-3-phosphate acyltransferase n=1 Tax=Nitrincola tapanii TaxID=1708751 RepID=A0A5A9VYF2_9GAMM|nr:glycerol-3-phosphate 1-O-acyltransferase PlsY [Nitrincola tapanii]KAA0873560.1 glycerol-3-phosphate 1-O-acyltransferase [Nitrincola tapanii]